LRLSCLATVPATFLATTLIALVVFVAAGAKLNAYDAGTPATDSSPARSGATFAVQAADPIAIHSNLFRKPAAGAADAMRLAQIWPKVEGNVATSGNPAQAPFKWAGLLVIPDPTPKSPNSITLCTAQFIKPNVLLTAAHCVKNIIENPTGPWPDPKKGVFYLQYQNDSGSQFNILCAATNSLWDLPKNYTSMTAAQKSAADLTVYQHDFAMILVDHNSSTGVMPYAVDWRGANVTSILRIGYPGAILDSAIIQEAPGSLFFGNAIPLDLGGTSTANIVVQWGPVTDATQGMSGGAWVANVDPGERKNTNILIAVTSFVDNRYPGAAFAAYLTSAEFNPLLTFVSNGCK
jgi:hypothetical protein